MKRYEVATNSHDISKLRPLIATGATYWFTDGSYVGIADIEAVIIKTFQAIQDECYSIRSIEWIATSAHFAVCVYDFEWSGLVNGRRKEGSGEGQA